MSIYKRGRVYWFKFHFEGESIRESTKQANRRRAGEMEIERKNCLITERNERTAALERLGCQEVSRCPECEKLFDGRTTIKDAVSGQQFCSDHCHSTWVKKQDR